MIFDVTAIGVLISLLMNSINLGIVVKNMLSAGEKKLEERLVKAETKMVEYDRRIQTLEAELKHLPDRDTAHRLELAIEKMNGRLDTMAEALKPVATTNQRLQEFLLEQGQK